MNSVLVKCAVSRLCNQFPYSYIFQKCSKTIYYLYYLILHTLSLSYFILISKGKNKIITFFNLSLILFKKLANKKIIILLIYLFLTLYKYLKKKYSILLEIFMFEKYPYGLKQKRAQKFLGGEPKILFKKKIRILYVYINIISQ